MYCFMGKSTFKTLLNFIQLHSVLSKLQYLETGVGQDLVPQCKA